MKRTAPKATLAHAQVQVHGTTPTPRFSTIASIQFADWWNGAGDSSSRAARRVPACVRRKSDSHPLAVTSGGRISLVLVSLQADDAEVSRSACVRQQDARSIGRRPHVL